MKIHLIYAENKKDNFVVDENGNKIAFLLNEWSHKRYTIIPIAEEIKHETDLAEGCSYSALAKVRDLLKKNGVQDVTF